MPLIINQTEIVSLDELRRQTDIAIAILPNEGGKECSRCQLPFERKVTWSSTLLNWTIAQFRCRCGGERRFAGPLVWGEV